MISGKVKVTLVAEFEMDSLEQASDINDAIDDAVNSLEGQGVLVERKEELCTATSKR